MEKTREIKAQSVCFSGHRLIPQGKRKGLKRELRAEIARAYSRGVRNFYCGMALGFDTLAVAAALSLQCELPGMKIIAVVPFKGQADRWMEEDRELYEDIIANVDEVVVLSGHYSEGCLLRRNDYMLEHSDGVIAYFDGHPKGGTYYTCKKAKAYGLEVVNLYDRI